MSETGLVFLKEDRSAFSVSLVLLENTSNDDSSYEYGLSEKDMHITFNDIEINTKTDENGFFSIDFPAVDLIKIYTEDPTIKKLVDSKMSLEELFSEDSSEICIDKYILCLNIYPIYDDTVELYFPPQIMESSQKVNNSRLVIKKENEKYFYRLLDKQNDMIFGSPYGNGYFRAYSGKHKRNEKLEFSMTRQLIIMENQLKQQSYIDSILQRSIGLDTVEVTLDGFNFYSDTGSVCSHDGEKVFLESWSTGEVVFYTNYESKEFFLINKKGNSLFFSLDTERLISDTKENPITNDTDEVFFMEDTTEMTFIEDTFEKTFSNDTFETDFVYDDSSKEVLFFETEEVDLETSEIEIKETVFEDSEEIRFESDELSPWIVKNEEIFLEEEKNNEQLNHQTDEINLNINKELFFIDTQEMNSKNNEDVDTIEISFYLTDTKEISFNIFEDSEETDVFKYTYSDTAEIEWNKLLSDYHVKINKNTIIETDDKDWTETKFCSKNIYLIDNKQERYILFLNKKNNLEKMKLEKNVTTDKTD